MEELAKLLDQISGYVWGPPMLFLLFGTHIFLTIRLRFIQKFIGKAIKISLERSKEGEGDVSQFGALTTALAATIGTGNIVGVATAVASGGPGAVLWMWLTGVFGVATKYAEAVLSVKYRVTTKDGSMAGGPMYALERGMNAKWLGIVFAALTAVAAFGIGSMVQANSISELVKETFGISPWISGAIMTILTAVVILGGIKSIAKVCEALVPFMAFFYVGGCLILLIIKYDTIPQTIMLILSSAFTGQAAAGGFLGAGVAQAMRYGIARGLFSNESGLGSAPIVAAAAQTRNPVRQALVSSTGTFWDTVVVCLITGLVIVNSGGWTRNTIEIENLPPNLKASLETQKGYMRGSVKFENIEPSLKVSLAMAGAWPKVRVELDKLSPDLKAAVINAKIIDGEILAFDKAAIDIREAIAKTDAWSPTGLKGSVLTKCAFEDIPTIGPIVLTIGLLTFVFSTILGWSYYGEKASEYLFGPSVITPYRILWVISVMVGSVVSLKMVWDFADIANGLMAIPNLISLLVLNKVIREETRKYLWEGNIDN